jgi:hypothetical protein
MRIRRIVVLACAAMLAACEGSTTPDTVEGSYDLTVFDGRDLPVWANATGVEGIGRQLRGGTLRLRAPNQLELVLRNRIHEADDAAPQNVADTLHGTYTMEGDSLRLAVQAKGMYWLESRVTYTPFHRIDGVLHLVAPVYTGYGHTLVNVSFTR